MPFRVRVNLANTVICAPDWSVDFGEAGARWVDYDLWIMRQGSGTFQTPQQKYRLQTGDCFLLRGGEAYIGKADPDNPPVVTYIHFDYLNKSGHPLRPFPRVPNRHRFICDMLFFGKLLDRLVDSYHHADGLDSSRSWLCAILEEIDRVDGTETPATTLNQYTDLIDELCVQIRSHPEQNHTLQNMAKRLHVTPHHFGRVFKKLRGTSPGEFILQARIDKAKQLLLHSNHPIGRIAEILGYCDVYHFSRQFKTRTGLSPMTFRQRPITDSE